MSEKLSDSWQTPQALLDELNQEFNFDVDLCATAENSKCDYYYEDYLNNKIVDPGLDNHFTMKLSYPNFKDNLTCFMNPPYSNPKPFIEKAWEDSKHCRIVCLVKCDPSTRWWATFWEYNQVAYFRGDEGETILVTNYNGPKPGCEVRFLPKRVKFVPPKGFEGKATGPSFSSAILIFDRRGL